MKINDKHLRLLAIGLCAPDKQGFLLKQGEQHKTFQKRWFVLKGNLLFYFEKAADREPVGVIILQNCVVQMSESEEAFAFELDFEGTGSRTYVLAAETQEDMEDWMRAITSASYDFMRLKVKELQQRLDELIAEQSVVSPLPGSASTFGTGVSFQLESPLSLPLGGPVQPGASSEHQRSGRKPDLCANRLPSDLQQRQTDNRVRNFEEMHNDFGKNIQGKVKGVIHPPRL